MSRPLPTWSRPPHHAWRLEEIKQGHVVASHSLNDILKSHSATDNCSITFGRMDEPTIVDVVTAHESCSRLHARIAFDANGTPWLRDLGSGNGTYVNEKRMPPEACGKGEPATSRKGSRGVVLYPGDAIRFGASTRIYILEGPEEFEREQIKLKQKMKAIETAADTSEIAAGKKEEVESAKANDDGCGWGMSDDTPVEQEEKAQSARNHSDLPLPSIDSFFFSGKHKISDNLHKLHGQYNTKMHKLQSIQTESQRIAAKGNMGVELTEGQRGQLAKNQSRITELEKNVADLQEKLEDGMHTAIHGKDRINKKRKDEAHYGGDDDDVDDFFDRTASSKRQRKDEGAQSEQSLIAEWKSLLEDRAKHQRKVARALERSEALQRQIDNSKEDDEDAFFLQNDLSLAKDTWSKATNTLEETEKELDEAEQLLRIVNPKLLWNREEGLIGTDIEEKRKPAPYEEIAKAEESDSLMMPPPPPPPVAETAETLLMPPPPPTMMAPPPPPKPKSPEPAGEMAPPTDTRGMPPPAEPKGAAEPDMKKKRQLGPMRPPARVQGTLAALTQAMSQPAQAREQPNQSASQQGGTNAQKPAVAFDPKKDVWQAPADQDGSGRTALHDKFKGRY
ncbi:hypothetical protein ACHAXT_006723 [Thalassiosira profunda]